MFTVEEEEEKVLYASQSDDNACNVNGVGREDVWLTLTRLRQQPTWRESVAINTHARTHGTDLR